MKKTMFRRATAMAGVVGAAVVGLTLVSGGTAQAATPGNLTICTGQDFFLTVTFPDRGGLSLTPAKRPGEVTCATAYLGGNGNERIDVSVPNGPYLGSSIYNGSRGTEVHGIPGPSFYAV